MRSINYFHLRKTQSRWEEIKITLTFAEVLRNHFPIVEDDTSTKDLADWDTKFLSCGERVRNDCLGIDLHMEEGP